MNENIDKILEETFDFLWKSEVHRRDLEELIASLKADIDIEVVPLLLGKIREFDEAQDLGQKEIDSLAQEMGAHLSSQLKQALGREKRKRARQKKYRRYRDE